MFVGVSNEQTLTICARVGMAIVLAYARVTHYGTYLQSLYGIWPCTVGVKKKLPFTVRSHLISVPLPFNPRSFSTRSTGSPSVQLIK